MSNAINVDNLDNLTSKEITSTGHGKCYLTEDNMVFVLTGSCHEADIKKLSKFYSTHFYFPRVLVYIDNKLVGYLREPNNGDSVDNLPNFVSYESYQSEIERVEREIDVLTQYRLRLLGIGKENIFYSEEEGIRVVDVEAYQTVKNSNGLRAYNVRDFAYSVLSPAVDISKPEFRDDKLNEYSHLTYEGFMNPSNLLYEINDKMEKQDIEKTDNFMELKKQIRYLQK